ncbi:MAG: hypothetical protein JNG88_08805 [Phycisphaerales bacterium]|nr:hypothetical protein [Phycisphaerales bacterium]
MSKRQGESGADAKRGEEPSPEQRALIEEVEARCAFGPLFFLTQLRGLVRDRCPDAAEIMPVVEVHMHSGEGLDVCHVIGAAPRYAVLAVYEEGEATDSRAMRTELVPYELIMRVTIRAVRPSSPRMGFNAVHAPTVIKQDPVMTPEEALRAVAIGPLPTATAAPVASLGAKRRVVTDRVRGASDKKRRA